MTGVSVFHAPTAHAQGVDAGLNAVGNQTGLTSQDPRLIAARVINMALGLIGIIMLVLIIYAGFLWMTSGGNEEQVTRAKTMIRNAIVGVIIILMSWALTTFVINALLNATTGGGGAGGSGGGGPGSGGFGGGGGSTSFQLRAISPSEAVPIRNIEVRFVFSRDVEAASASTSIHVLKASDGSEVPGTIGVDGSLVTFTPAATCPDPNASRYCFDVDTDYIARVNSSLQSTSGLSLVCGGFAPVCEGRFRSGSIVDTAPPVVAITSPFEGQPISADDLIRVISHATDDAGVSIVKTNVDGILIGTSAASGTQVIYDASVDWDTTAMTPGPRQIQSRAYDIDSNNAQSSVVTVQVRPRHCSNRTLDADETAIDCGGSCGVCPGGACTDPGLCASGVCTAGVCVEQPVITSVSPDNGRPGTFVSISGVNFGLTPGTVTFSSGVTASAPAVCAGAGSPTWTPTLVIVSAPEGAVDGPITLRNAAALSDATNDARGPSVDDFDVNTSTYPGLCAVAPASGVAGAALQLRGTGLGTASDKLFFNDRLISSFLSWSDSAVRLNAPVFSPATYAVQANVGGVNSNAVEFRLDAPTTAAGPIIDSISPGTGPIGEYVTIQGRNFGTGIGSVLFKLGDGTGIGSTDFPAECSTAFWSDSSVTIKVPATFHSGLADTGVTPGAWKILLKRQDLVESNQLDFAVSSGEAHAGICAIRPIAGPVGTSIEIIGERFGAFSTGQVLFSAPSGARVPMSVASADWTSNSIKGLVPTGSQTGPVKVNQGSSNSNDVNFAVRNCNEDASICGGRETCCRSGACSIAGICAASSPNAEFAWVMSTGILPVNPEVVEECAPTRPASPSPWSGRTGGDRACVNTDLFLRFTTLLNVSTVRVSGATPTLVVHKCTGPAETPCSTVGAAIPPATSGAITYPIVGADTDTGYVLFRPRTMWEGNSTYQVILTTGIQSSTNIPMLEKRDSCGVGNAYCFTFSTRPDTETCRIGTVNNVPAAANINELGGTVGLSAMPRAADDICLNLRADAYDWTWNAADARVEVTNDEETRADGSRRGLENQMSTGRGETGATPVPVDSSVTQGTETITGRSDISVRLQPPRVISYGPNCDKTCLNAAAWAIFNVAMDPAFAINSNVTILPCVNENCLAYGSPLDLTRARVRLTPAPASASLANTYFVIEPTRPGVGGADDELLLEPGRFYRITLKGGTMSGFRSLSGLPLTGLNAPEGFSWTFRVKEGDNARCAVASVSVVPGEKFETAVGNRQLFSATPMAAQDGCSGGPVVSDRSYAWTIDQTTNVSRYIKAGGAAGVVDTGLALPVGCSNRCTSLGASGIVGRVASCGNGVIETTDTNYCRAGRTPFGTACTLLAAGSKGGEECDDATTSCDATTCLWKPMTGGTCGNSTVNRGEQCDAGVAGSAGCNTTCQLLGSRAGGSTCGNNDVASGEACDDGNATSGDGCSADCLHEGSSRVVALCGNGRLEPGESCDSVGGVFPATCNSTTCLNLGTAAPTCGNGVQNPGEDCDDGNIISGDGCNTMCLSEGASASYASPSFCGDGVRGRGEMCETVSLGDGKQDPTQFAEIVGEGVPVSSRLSSSIHTVYDSKTGLATYGLQCGYTEESSCSAGTGLDAAGCCAPRPLISNQVPANLATNVCRNVMISGVFNVKMDEASVQTNFVVGYEKTLPACPAGTTQLTRIEDFDDTPGIAGFFRRTWTRILSWFRTPSALATNWCVGSVAGRLSFEPSGAGTLASFSLDHALATSTHYQVLFRGDTNLADNSDITKRDGVKSFRGVVANNHFKWEFTTGLLICSVTAISVHDTNATSPNLFTKFPESHFYTARSIALMDGIAVALSPVSEYAWSWEPWIASNMDALEAESGTGAGTNSQTNVAVVNPPKNGSSFVEAGIRITTDSANVPSTRGRIVKGTQPAQVLICENPWPNFATAPFAEVSGHASLGLLGSSTLANEIRTAGPYFNFSTLYCRDAGAASSIADDLPSMGIQPIAISAGDSSMGILRQYILTFGDDAPSLRGDGIGLRVASNPLHLTPAGWYASRGFTGTPEMTTVDGFEAVKDGNTWYIGGVNTADASSAPVYSQIYIVSNNPDAKPVTVEIVNQLVKNFALNANLSSGANNACQYAVAAGVDHPVGSLYRATDGKLVRCTADWECVSKNPNLLCASFKSKMQRDSKRVVDFQFMSQALETSKGRTGAFPKLQSGTFVPTLATSRWPSWSQQLQSEVGVAFPTDPVNRFLSCGVCSDNATPCQDASECNPGAACNAGASETGVEPATCWNPSTARYMCPRLNASVPESTSRIYQYRSMNAGDRYELATELEGALSTRYVPPLIAEIKRCSNVASSCRVNSDCDVFLSSGAVQHGTCNGTGGLWRYANVCGDTAYSSGGGVCGDGVRGTGEFCELGDTNPVACTTLSGAAGTELYICSDCREYLAGPATTCVANVQCGNGRVDAGETCDDGSLNGNYGHCNRACTGYDAFCGDGRLSPGESCDLGSTVAPRNGDYCQHDCDAALSCSMSCTGPGPRCGNGTVDAGFEACDGNSEQTPKAVCVGGINVNNPCDTSSECPESTCGGADPSTTSCVGVTARRCSNEHEIECTSDIDCESLPPVTPTSPTGRCIAYPTARTRTCNDYGSVASTDLWCKWNGWSACQPVGFCGDGHTDAGEECDDGNTSNNDSCTTSCKTNVCGDGFYRTGVEECDLGSVGLVAPGMTPKNGTRSCTADYGSSCLSCSASCRSVASSGGYCGNGVKEGAEQCDGTQGLGVCHGTTNSCSSDSDCTGGLACDLISCRSLGYDYSTTVSCGNYGYVRSIADPNHVVCVNKNLAASDFACAVCLTGSDCGVEWVHRSYAPSEFPKEVAEKVCLPDPAPCSGICLRLNPPKHDVLQCAASCSLTGCARCVDSTGTGTISAQIFDAVYSTQPVPNARVTLYNRGIRVSEVTTGEDGRFTFSNVNAVSECTAYHIVVDSYTDNPCTGPRVAGSPACAGQSWPGSFPVVDEGTNGGYWPFESDNFGVTNFYSKGLNNINGKIYLAPRVGEGETLVIHTWSGRLPRYIDAHLLVPQSQGYTYGGAKHLGSEPYSYNTFTIPPIGTPGVSRDINYGPQGNPDMNVAPHANLFCFTPLVSGGLDLDCNSFSYAPQTMKFKRGSWATTGKYSFYLVDFSPSPASPSHLYFDQTSSTVRVITSDRVYSVDAPIHTVAPCTPTSGVTAGTGKYWDVFEQDASTGAVYIVNELRCAGQQSGQTPPASLPPPLQSVGS